MESIKGIVCKTLDYKDSSKILYLYTAEGRKSVIARGVKKFSSLNRFLSQIGNLIQFNTTRGDLPTLKEGELINDFPKTKLDLETYTFINHILELVNGTIDEFSNHPKMFDFLIRLMNLFDQEIDPEQLTFIFELKLFYFLGYGLNFTKCNTCGEVEQLVYSISDGGLVCRRHLNPKTEFYDEAIYRKLQALYVMDINKLTLVELNKNERILLRHIIDITIDEFLSFKTKSRNILKQIKKY